MQGRTGTKQGAASYNIRRKAVALFADIVYTVKKAVAGD